MRTFPKDLTWTWDEGVRIVSASSISPTFSLTGALGLGVIGLVAGLVSGIAEALGMFYSLSLAPF